MKNKDTYQVTAILERKDVDRVDRIQELDVRRSRSATIAYLISRGLEIVEKELGVVKDRK